MPKSVLPLTHVEIKQAKPQEKEYTLGDGNGLRLRVSPTGSKVWIFNYTHPITKKRKNIGLGAFPQVSLALARQKTQEMQELLAQNIDPKTYRENTLAAQRLEHESTLLVIAKEWFELKKDSVSPKYADSIWRSLEKYIFPSLGQLPIKDILAPTVINLLKPIEQKGTYETLKRICQRLNEIMIFAVNSGKIETNNLIGIRHVFKKPKPQRMKTVAPSELVNVMQMMSSANMQKITRAAFEFQLHTLTRPSECACAEWDEIDLENKLWIIPKVKMKMNRDHKIPLTSATIEILEFMKVISFNSKYIFPSYNTPKSHLNSQSVNAVLRRAGLQGRLVSHGLRSIGSTALNEQGFNRDAIELCLSHVDNNKIRDAYNNAEYLEQRQEIMEWWSNFIIKASKNSYTIVKNQNKL